MKNQNDLIISISGIVVAVIVCIVIFATAPTASRPADPTVVDVTTPKLPAADVSYANALPGGTSVGGGAFGGRGPGGSMFGSRGAAGGGGGRGPMGGMPPGMPGGIPGVPGGMGGPAGRGSK